MLKDEVHSVMLYWSGFVAVSGYEYYMYCCHDVPRDNSVKYVSVSVCQDTNGFSG